MDLFSISDLQSFSGIKAHTIRMWEQRYSALEPLRSDGNTRYYDGIQLRRLLNIVSLMNTGYKVSQLGSMPDESLHKLIDKHFAQSSSGDPREEYLISQIIAAALRYDEAYFDKVFLNGVLRLGMKECYIKVIYPVLQRLGLVWSKNTLHPGQEHFITNLFRQKILSAIDALPPPSSKISWLLFLPENEFHEIGLLFSNFLIRHSGKKVIYLGQNVPFHSLESAVGEVKPARLLMFLVRKRSPEEESKYISLLSKNFPGQRIYIACDDNRLTHIKTARNLVTLHSVRDLEEAIISK